MIDVERLVRETLARHEANVPTLDIVEAHPVAVRTRRRQLLNAIGAGLIAAVIALLAATSIGALLRADEKRPAIEPTPTPAPPTSFAPVAFPAAGVEPSTPLTQGVVVSFYSEDVRPVGPGEPDEVERTVVQVHADGRVISSRCIFEAWTGRPPQRPEEDGCWPGIATRSQAEGTGWFQQRITSEAVELLRSQLLSTGLFVRDFESVTTNSTDLVDYLSAEVQGPSRKLNVRADFQSLDFNPPTPDVEAGLQHIQDILLDLEGWLPSSAWEDKSATSYVPSSYLFWFKRGRGVKTVLRDANSVEVVDHLDPQDLPPPADRLLSRHGCDAVTLDEARAIVEGFEAVGILPSAEMSHMDLLAFLVVDGEPAGALYFRPSFEDLPPDC